jgi:hypothetical protein
MTLNERDAYLMGLGLSILHISDNDVKKNLEGVIATIKHYPSKAPPRRLRRPPSKGGEFVSGGAAEIADILSAYVERNDEAKRLGALYVDLGGLSPKSGNDAMHIAIATINKCDIVLSWTL